LMAKARRSEPIVFNRCSKRYLGIAVQEVGNSGFVLEQQPLGVNGRSREEIISCGDQFDVLSPRIDPGGTASSYESDQIDLMFRRST
jgi:hypothetical protein